VATGIETRITEALHAHLADLVLTPPLPIAWPNIAFDPIIRTEGPDGVPLGWYLRANEVVLPTEAIALRDGSNRYRGLFQVDVVFPIDIGLTVPREVASAICAHFKRGTKRYRESVRVEIVRPPYASTALKDAPGMMIPVTIPYQCIHSNPA
jgi:hypothetical protein